MKIKYYIESFRLRTLPLSVSGIILGSMLSAGHGNFDAIIFTLAILTTLSLQILSNLTNELGDLQKGTDNDNRIGPIRSIQSGKLSVNEFKNTIIVFVLLSLFFGLALVSTAIANIMSFESILMLCLGGLSVIAAIKYTVGKSAYGYKGLGDIAVFVFFGLVSVIGSYFLMSQGSFNFHIILPAISIGSFSVGVLNINNMRDIENDKRCGKRTIPVIIGTKNAKFYHYVLITIGFLSMICYSILNDYNLYQYIYLCSLPLFIFHILQVQKCNAKQLDSQLKLLSVSTLLFAILSGVSVFL